MRRRMRRRRLCGYRAAVCGCPGGGFCYNRYTAEVNLAWWLAWTSNPVVFTGRWARWVRFPCTSATFVFNALILSNLIRQAKQFRRSESEVVGLK